jgi:hypothetical protein
MPIRAYDGQDDMLKVKSMQQKFRDSFAGSDLNTEKWTKAIAASQEVSVSGGTLIFSSGAEADAEGYLLAEPVFTVPFKLSFNLTLSQRIINQAFYIELISVDPSTGVPDGLHAAGFIFDDITATKARYFVQNSGYTSLVSGLVTLPSTAGTSMFEIETFCDETYFHGKTMDSTTARTNSYVRHQQIPDPNAYYRIRLRWLNGSTAPASSTNAVLQFVACQDYAELTCEVTAGRGQTAAGQGLGVNVIGSVPVTGSATHDSAGSSIAGFKNAGTAVSANPATVSASGDIVNLIATMIGALVTQPYAIPESMWKYSPAKGGITNSTAINCAKAGAGTGVRNYITDIGIYADVLANATEVEVREADITCNSQTVSSNTLTTAAAHGLSVGDQIVVTATTVTGLTVDTTYSVKTVPSTTTLTLSATADLATTLAISGTAKTATFHKVLYVTKVPAGGCRFDRQFASPLRGSVNSVICIQATTASGTGSIYVSLAGYIAP